MFNAKPLLVRQSNWQHKRAHSSWSDKIRMAENVRDGVKALKQERSSSVNKHTTGSASALARLKE